MVAEFLERRCPSVVSGDDNQVGRTPKQVAIEAKDFLQTTPDSVPNDRLADLAGDRQTKA